MEFEWDDAKAESNLRKHGITFEEAMIQGMPTRRTASCRWARRSMGGSWWYHTPIAATRFASSAPVRLLGVSERTTRMAASPDDLEANDDIQPEYDFRSLRGVVRGKYAGRYQERLRVVRLAADVAEAFADDAAVNAALREYLSWRQERPAANPA